MNTKFNTITGIAAFCFAGAVHASAVFTLSSPQITQSHFAQDQLSSAAYGFGCKGNNRSPKLMWSNPPAGTQSYALQVYDRDAPTGLGWVHWQVVNIPASSLSLVGGITPDNKGLTGSAIQTRTDFGVPGYAGACPPAGQTHHYIITLTALKVAKLANITADSTPAMVGYNVNANALGTAHIDVYQSR